MLLANIYIFLVLLVNTGKIVLLVNY